MATPEKKAKTQKRETGSDDKSKRSSEEISRMIHPHDDDPDPTANMGNYNFPQMLLKCTLWDVGCYKKTKQKTLCALGCRFFIKIKNLKAPHGNPEKLNVTDTHLLRVPVEHPVLLCILRYHISTFAFVYCCI